VYSYCTFLNLTKYENNCQPKEKNNILLILRGLNINPPLLEFDFWAGVSYSHIWLFQLYRGSQFYWWRKPEAIFIT